jgi:cytochrome c6
VKFLEKISFARCCREIFLLGDRYWATRNPKPCNPKHEDAMMKSWIILLLLTLLTWTGIIAAPVFAAVQTNTVQGPELFAIHCAGCHVGGGNIIRRNKNLKLQALQRNHVETVEAIAALITHGKGNLMSAYGDRLTAAEIANLAAYVFDQAQHDWK